MRSLFLRLFRCIFLFFFFSLNLSLLKERKFFFSGDTYMLVTILTHKKNRDLNLQISKDGQRNRSRDQHDSERSRHENSTSGHACRIHLAKILRTDGAFLLVSLLFKLFAFLGHSTTFSSLPFLLFLDYFYLDSFLTKWKLWFSCEKNLGYNSTYSYSIYESCLRLERNGRSF